VKKNRIRQIQKVSKHKKVENVRANNRPEDAPYIAQRKKDIDSKEEV